MKHRIAVDSLSREFRLLRNRIEAEMHAPAVILVTSATERDGAGMTAFGLAESLSHTHQRTALVTTAPRPAADGESGIASQTTPTRRRRATDKVEADQSDSGLSIISISHERLSTISRSGVTSLVTELRGKHDYVVIDAADLPNNSFALLLLASADAILLTFQAGRQQDPNDRIMLDTLERTEAKMLGVVMTTDQSVLAHSKDDMAAAGVAMEVIVPKKTTNPLFHSLESALQRFGKTF